MTTLTSQKGGGTKKSRDIDAENQLVAGGLESAWVFESIDSTMDEARHLLSEIRTAGSSGIGVVIAREQKSGRGRQGRQWSGASEALAATFTVNLKTEIGRLQGLGLAVGCAVAGSIEAVAGEVGVKWPNDLLCKGSDGKWRKIAGILVEADSDSSGTSLYIGIGVNLSGAPAGLDKATDILREFRCRVQPIQLVLEIFPRLRELFKTFETRDFAFEVFRREWLLRCMHKGWAITVDQGAEVIEGRVADITNFGALEIETISGNVTVIAGHVLSLTEQ